MKLAIIDCCREFTEGRTKTSCFQMAQGGAPALSNPPFRVCGAGGLPQFHDCRPDRVVPGRGNGSPHTLNRYSPATYRHKPVVRAVSRQDPSYFLTFAAS